MKIIYTLSAFYLFQICFSHAQNLLLCDTSGNTIINGDTLVVSGTTNDFMLAANVQVYNPSSVAKKVLVEKTNLLLVHGTYTYFSFGFNMYDTSTTISVDSWIIPGGVTDSGFYGVYVFGGLPGTSYARYNFFDSTNTSDSAWLVIKYNVQQTTSMIERSFNKKINIYPNPSTGLIQINYDGEIQTVEFFTPEGKLLKKGVKEKIINLNEVSFQKSLLILKIILDNAVIYKTVILE